MTVAWIVTAALACSTIGLTLLDSLRGWSWAFEVAQVTSVLMVAAFLVGCTLAVS